MSDGRLGNPITPDVSGVTVDGLEGSDDLVPGDTPGFYNEALEGASTLGLELHVNWRPFHDLRSAQLKLFGSVYNPAIGCG